MCGETSSKAAASCAAAEKCKAGTKLYWLRNRQGHPFQAKCDMDQLGGGWMKIDAAYLNKHAKAKTISGSASLSGNTITMKAKSILEIDLGVRFTEYRMYLSASKGDGKNNPDDTIGYTDSAFLSNALQTGTLKYNKNTYTRNGIRLATFTPGNSCENDGTSQVIAWGTDKRVHDLKVGGEFGCNFQVCHARFLYVLQSE